MNLVRAGWLVVQAREVSLKVQNLNRQVLYMWKAALPTTVSDTSWTMNGLDIVEFTPTRASTEEESDR